VAAIASNWSQADIRDGYPLAGSTFRVFAYVPDARAGRNMEIALDDSGRMISLEYGSPEGSVRRLDAQPLPPPDNVTVQLFEWGTPSQGHSARDCSRPARHRTLTIGPSPHRPISQPDPGTITG